MACCSSARRARRPLVTLMPAAIAMKPSRASRPGIKVERGITVVLRRITSRLRDDSVAGIA